MYDKSLFLKLNNYGYSDKSVIEVKDYLINLKLPDKADTNAKGRRYYEKWNQFEIRDDKLFYKKLNLEVIPDDKRDEKMKELYENEITGPGRGIEMFYHTICDKYLNIRRSDKLFVSLKKHLHLIVLYSNIYRKLYDKTSQFLFLAHLYRSHTIVSFFHFFHYLALLLNSISYKIIYRL